MHGRKIPTEFLRAGCIGKLMNGNNNKTFHPVCYFYFSMLPFFYTSMLLCIYASTKCKAFCFYTSILLYLLLCLKIFALRKFYKICFKIAEILFPSAAPLRAAIDAFITTPKLLSSQEATTSLSFAVNSSSDISAGR